jgi:S-DNA-T family DNA segregation ATPase FtsK/SpoIIIE
MARTKKQSAKQLALDLKPGRDERRVKVSGLVALLLAAYLTIAFTSYLFTWYRDQDLVLQHSWSMLFDGEVIVDNWLGKVGALVANLFIYFGFGIGAFILIFQLYRLGMFLVLEKRLRAYWPGLRKSLFLVVVVSVYCAFLFQEASFPYGGAFGQKINTWLVGLLGQIGMSLLLVASILGALVWIFNPDFKQMGLPEWMVKALNSMKNFRLGRADMAEDFEESITSDNKAKKSNPTTVASQSLEEGIDLRPLSGPLAKPAATPSRRPELVLETADLPEPEPEAKPTPPMPELITASTSLREGTHPVLADDENAHSEPYDPTLELSRYQFPSLELLRDYSSQQLEVDREELEQNKDQILETLMHYKIEIIKIRATIGPTVTLYEIVPAPGIKISRIRNLEDDIALSLSALGIRIIAPIPGKGTIGIEVPNKKKQVVGLREILASDKFRNVKMDLPIALGKTISNEVFVADLAKMPHLLIAGATGQGKSVGINSVLISLLYRKHPAQLKLVLIDPKKVELYPYGQLANHFLAFLPEQIEPIVTDNNQVIYTLNSLCIEMDTRYELLMRAKTRNLREYNEKFIARRLNPKDGHRFLPFIVLVIDEFADLILTAGREVEQPLARLAQLARAVGIHLIIATQRPSVNIITGSIKANFPARIAFKVASKIDSRTILDGGGADQLIGQGDMLLSVGGDVIRLQGAFVDTSEVEEVLEAIGNQQGFPEPYFLPEYNPDNPNSRGALDVSDLDDMFADAARIVVSNQHGSTSMIQRRLKLGYNRAGRIMDQLEGMGIVGPAEGSKPREVLIGSESELERFLEAKSFS